MYEAMSILRSKKTEVQDPDEAFNDYWCLSSIHLKYTK